MEKLSNHLVYIAVEHKYTGLVGRVKKVYSEQLPIKIDFVSLGGIELKLNFTDVLPYRV